MEEAQSVPSLNLEYFFLKAYEAATSFDYTSLPEAAQSLVVAVFIIGMFVSLVLIIMLVYAQIRLLQVEHEGFHAFEAEHASEHAHRQGGRVGEEEAEQVPRGNERWERIKELTEGPSPGDWRRAILEADIMLAAVLDQQGYSGATVADQLRQANPLQMTTLDLAWQAHKVRNAIAHQGESYPLSEREARATIDYYKRVFEEFGAL